MKRAHSGTFPIRHALTLTLSILFVALGFFVAFQLLPIHTFDRFMAETTPPPPPQCCEDGCCVTCSGPEAPCPASCIGYVCTAGTYPGQYGCKKNIPECTNPTAGRCGDGIKNNTDEECDDGNYDDDDGCTSNCEFTRGACCEKVNGAVTGRCTLASPGVQAGTGAYAGQSYTAEQNCTAWRHKYMGDNKMCGCTEGDSCFNETLCPPDKVVCCTSDLQQVGTYTCNADSTINLCAFVNGTALSGQTSCSPNPCPHCPAPGSCSQVAGGQSACPAGTTDLPDGTCMKANERCCQPNQCVIIEGGSTVNCKNACDPICEVSVVSPFTPCVAGACCELIKCEKKETQSTCNPPGDTSGCFGFGIKFPAGYDTSTLEQCFINSRVINSDSEPLKEISGSLEGCINPAISDVKITIDKPCVNNPSCDNGCTATVLEASFKKKGDKFYPAPFNDPFALHHYHVWGECKYTTECRLSDDCLAL